MTALPVVSGRECIKALQRAGFYISHQKGSHVTMRRDEPKGKVVVMHKTLKTGTLRSIIKQAGLTVEEFVRFLD